MSEGNGHNWSADVKELGDKIVALARPQAAELSEYLDSVHRIKGAEGGGGGFVPPPTPDLVPVAEPTEFNVILDGVADPGKKIAVIKVVRKITQPRPQGGQGPRGRAPKTVKENLPKADAEAMKKKIEDNGGKASVKAAG